VRVCGGGNSTAPICRTDRVFASYRPPEPVTRCNASVGFLPARAPQLAISSDHSIAFLSVLTKKFDKSGGKVVRTDNQMIQVVRTDKKTTGEELGPTRFLAVI
jgi:hypothetical protein